MQILAMTGSLRAESRNTNLLLAAARLAPAGIEVSVFRELDALPHFNPDIEELRVPPSVLALRERLARAGALLVCSPEYAHGVPGAFKNALDWLVGAGLERRPVGILNAAPRSTHAHAALREILRTMDGDLIPAAELALPLTPQHRDPAAIAADPALAGPLQQGLAALVAAARTWQAPRP